MELEAICKSKSSQELFDYMEENLIDFFSTPDIPKHYGALRNVDFSACKKPMPKLMMAWLALLSGDHASLKQILNNICETDFCGPEDSSMYYALKALIGSMLGSGDGLKYAKLSLDVLPAKEESFYLANAELTYGQLLAGSDRFREAAEMFASSCNIFGKLNLQFLAAVAMVNEFLNRCKLGEFALVIDKCNQALTMSGSFRGEMLSYWNIVHLPLGMCYYEMNKPNLAVRHLNLARESIDSFELFHMHGLIELYLFKAYFVLKDHLSMEAIMNDTIACFEHMHYRHMDLLISMFKVFSPECSDNSLKPEIEKLELEYMRSGAGSLSWVVDSLVYLKLRGLSDAIGIEDLEKRLERLRYIGIIPQIQMTLLQLAELSYLENNRREAEAYMKEAVQIYREFGISACFYMLQLESAELLQKINTPLYNLLCKNVKTGDEIKSGCSSILSVREKEIMRLIALGKTNEEMSRELYISVGTIKWHINHIFSKLQVKNRVQAIEKAKNLGEIL